MNAPGILTELGWGEKTKGNNQNFLLTNFIKCSKPMVGQYVTHRHVQLLKVLRRLTFPTSENLLNVTRVLYMTLFPLMWYQARTFHRFCHMSVSGSEPQARVSQFFCSQLGLASHAGGNFPFTLITAPRCWTIKCVCARLKPLDHVVEGGKKQKTCPLIGSSASRAAHIALLSHCVSWCNSK